MFNFISITFVITIKNIYFCLLNQLCKGMKKTQVSQWTSAFSLMFIFFVSCGDTAKDEVTVANITTNYGNIEFVLLDETPLHKQNFAKMCADSFYNDVLFHRVIENFMIQAGDANTRGVAAGEQYEEAEGEYTIKQEILPQFFHVRGAVAAARLGDAENSERASSFSHFYLVHGKNSAIIEPLLTEKAGILPEDIRSRYAKDGGAPHLDGAYTIFGYVVEGMDVVDKIAAVETAEADRPVENVIIKNITLTERDKSHYENSDIYKLFK